MHPRDLSPFEVNSDLSVDTIFVVPSNFSNANFQTNNGPRCDNSSRAQVLACPILTNFLHRKSNRHYLYSYNSYSYFAITTTFKFTWFGGGYRVL